MRRRKHSKADRLKLGIDVLGRRGGGEAGSEMSEDWMVWAEEEMHQGM